MSEAKRYVEVKDKHITRGSVEILDQEDIKNKANAIDTLKTVTLSDILAENGITSEKIIDTICKLNIRLELFEMERIADAIMSYIAGENKQTKGEN